MLTVETNPTTGKSHAVLTKAQRRKLADAKSLCYMLSNIEEDPRAEHAKEAVGALYLMLEAKEPVLPSVSQKTGLPAHN